MKRIIAVLAISFLIMGSCRNIDLNGIIDASGNILNFALNENEVVLAIPLSAQIIVNKNTGKQLNAVIELKESTTVEIVWSSSNPSVAAVSDSGFVTPVTEGNTDITASIPGSSFSDTCNIYVAAVPQFLSQVDPLWGSLDMGLTGDSIAPKGVLMVSCAMMMSVDDPIITPAVLNLHLQNNNGYAQDSSLLMYAAINSYPSTSFIYQGSISFNLSQLKTELNLGNPVIVSINSNTHFVLCVGFEGSGSSTGDFLCYNSADSTKTVHHLDEFSDFDSMKTFHR